MVFIWRSFFFIQKSLKTDITLTYCFLYHNGKIFTQFSFLCLSNICCKISSKEINGIPNNSSERKVKNFFQMEILTFEMNRQESH